MRRAVSEGKAIDSHHNENADEENGFDVDLHIVFMIVFMVTPLISA